MLEHQSNCSCCQLSHENYNVLSCYQKKIHPDFFINHIILTNKSHFSRSNQDNYLFWLNEVNYERYYFSNGQWHNWPLQYDLNATSYQQSYSNSLLETIPLGYGLIYLLILQSFFKKKIAQKKYKRVINCILKKAPVINKQIIPVSLIDHIVTLI